jgi:biopolymer transport protein ExbB/TolQ
MDFLTISFLAAVGLLFVFALPAQFTKASPDGKVSRWVVFGAAAPGLLTTIGIFGTFVGILVGLQGFDVTRVDESVPQLLAGLKTAFWSSAAGLGASIILRFFQTITGRSDTDTSDDPIEILKNQTYILRSIENNIAAQTKALSGGEDTSLLTQLQKLRTSLIDTSEAQKRSIEEGFERQVNALNSFAEKVAENNSKALIEALREVIRDFNAKINEQFGDNFKQLNEAVGKLLEWQERYKLFVEETEKTLRQAVFALDQSARNLVEATDAMEELPLHAKRVSEIMEKLSLQISVAGDMAAGVKELRDGLKNALPEVNANIDALTKNFSREVEKSAQILQASATQTKAQYDATNASLRAGVEELQKSMNRNFEQFDKSMQQELTRVISLMGQQLASISEKIAKDYTKLADSLSRNR